MSASPDRLVPRPEIVPLLAGRRILLVVTDSELRATLSFLLTIRGAQVHPVGSTIEALECYEGFVPDLIMAELGYRAATLASVIQASLHRPVYAMALGDVRCLWTGGASEV